MVKSGENVEVQRNKTAPVPRSLLSLRGICDFESTTMLNHSNCQGAIPCMNRLCAGPVGIIVGVGLWWRSGGAGAF